MRWEITCIYVTKDDTKIYLEHHDISAKTEKQAWYYFHKYVLAKRGLPYPIQFYRNVRIKPVVTKVEQPKQLNLMEAI